MISIQQNTFLVLINQCKNYLTEKWVEGHKQEIYRRGKATGQQKQMLHLTSYQGNTREDEISFFTHRTAPDLSLVIRSTDRERAISPNTMQRRGNQSSCSGAQRGRSIKIKNAQTTRASNSPSRYLLSKNSCRHAERHVRQRWLAHHRTRKSQGTSNVQLTEKWPKNHSNKPSRLKAHSRPLLSKRDNSPWTQTRILKETCLHLSVPPHQKKKSYVTSNWRYLTSWFW